MTPLRGRSPKGKRLVCKTPHGHRKTTTFLAALRHDRIDAPLVLDGPINGATFLAWVQQFLVPTLTPGDGVVVDNLASHKVAGVKEAIEGAGARLIYLPPYSPDLNPIEMMFSKLKALLRKAGERSVDALWTKIGSLLDQFPPTNAPPSSGMSDMVNLMRKRSKASRIDLKELLSADGAALRTLMRVALQVVLEAEMTDAVGASKGERTASRLGYRSGYYSRTLITRVGKLELRVPRDRDGRFSTELFERYQRSEKALVATLAEMYVQGVSTRKVKAITAGSRRSRRQPATRSAKPRQCSTSRSSNSPPSEEIRPPSPSCDGWLED